MAKKLKIWNGASWEDVTFAITPPTTNVTNSFTTNQVIDTSTSVAALRITQRGTGEALRVEDDTNPDSTPFVIDASGNVGIGTTNMNAVLNVQSAGTSTNAGGNIVARFQSNGSGYDSTIQLSDNIANSSTISMLGGATIFRQNGSESIRITSSGNLGVGTPSPTFKIQTYHDLATSVGSQSLTFQSQVNNGNQDYLKLYQERENSTASWGGSSWILRRHVDVTPMGGIKWGPGEWNPTAFYGAPTSQSIRTIHISTGTPSGGNDGDVWMVYA